MLVTQSESIIANQIIQLQIRAAGDRDVNKLVEYFGTLSRSSRYNRFMEPDSNFSRFPFASLSHSRNMHNLILIAQLKQEAYRAAIVVLERAKAGHPVGKHHRKPDNPTSNSCRRRPRCQ